MNLLRNARLARMGIPPERSIAQVLAKQRIEIAVFLEQGVCGTRVLAGKVEHRDLFLSKSDKAANTAITLCCSRAARNTTLILEI